MGLLTQDPNADDHIQILHFTLPELEKLYIT